LTQPQRFRPDRAADDRGADGGNAAARAFVPEFGPREEILSGLGTDDVEQARAVLRRLTVDCGRPIASLPLELHSEAAWMPGLGCDAPARPAGRGIETGGQIRAGA
jgi:hypothetical protein